MAFASSDQGARVLGAGVVERIGDIAQTVEGLLEEFVPLMQVAGGGGRQRMQAGHHAAPGSEGAQGVEDHDDIDPFLDEGAGDRGKKSERRGAHGETGQRHSGDNALHRDPPRPPRDRDRLRDPVKPIDQDHHIGGLRGGARAAGAHRNSDAGGGKGRRVVDAVADHERRIEPLLGGDGVDFVGGAAVGEHFVEIERRPDGLGGVGAVAGDHHDAADPGLSQCVNGARGLGA